MDLLLAACQGLGLALGIGILGGALAGLAGDGPGDGRAVTALLVLVAGAGGGIALGASLRAEDHPAWPGWGLGALAAALALVVVGAVVASAARRAGGGGSPLLIAAITGAAGLALAALSLTPASPVAIPAALGLAYIARARRRRAGQKYEGLRILRG